jgi:sec-independent protein translocase protein TatA
MNPFPMSLAFLDALGGSELILIFLVVLLLFGGEKLPELARGLGKSVREFKKATAGVEEEIKKAIELPPEKPKPKLENQPVAEPKNPFVVPPSEN